MNVIEGILQSLKDLTRRVSRLETHGSPYWVYLAVPLTSTSWDGDDYSTTAKTVIDLSVVFGTPAGIKAILARVFARDSASYGTSSFIGLSPNSTTMQFAVASYPYGKVNDTYDDSSGVCPCDANGDIYYQCVASGANTLDVYIQIWGYCI